MHEEKETSDETPIILVFDIETDIPVRTIWCIGIGIYGTDHVEMYVGPERIAEAIEILVNADAIAGHNIMSFDLPWIEKLHGVKFDRARAHDTLTMSKMLFPSRRKQEGGPGHSLREWGIELGLYKGDFDDFSKLTPEMVAYCEQDIRVTMKLLEVMVEAGAANFRPAMMLEQETSYIIAEQERTGFAFDVAGAIALADTLEAELAPLTDRLHQIFPPKPVANDKPSARMANEENYHKGAPLTRIEWVAFNPGSNVQIEERLRARGWQPEKFTETGKAKITDELLKVLQYPGAPELARSRRVKKMLGQLKTGDNAWLNFVTPEGRIHGSIDTLGTRTGRMAHFAPNVGQVDKEEQMRALWIAACGRVLVDCDAEGIEARLLAHHLFDRDGGKLASIILTGDKKLGTDIHSRNQRICALHFRDSAKTILYALFYGGGLEVLGMTVAEDCLKAGVAFTETFEEAGRRVKNALMKNITGYRELVEELKQFVRLNGYVVAIDGRHIPVEFEHTALNSLVQANGSIIMKRALVILNGYLNDTRLDAKFVANVHDEFVLEADDGDAADVASLAKLAITEAGDFYNVKCPMAGEAKIGTNWSEVH